MKIIGNLLIYTTNLLIDRKKHASDRSGERLHMHPYRRATLLGNIECCSATFRYVRRGPAGGLA